MFKIIFIALFLSACYVETSPAPYPTPSVPYPVPVNSYCGDGICDTYDGEDAWNCKDCNSPNGGYCGDGFCDIYEDCYSCSYDCGAVPYHS